jgi:hypothetical protein
MRVFLLIVALVLISASVVAFVWDGSVPVEGVQRSIVSGRLRWDLADRPWSGAVVSLGTENELLTADGEFKFAMLPGRYRLKICCSVRFQGIDQEVIVGKNDIALDLVATPLTEIAGQLTVQGGAQVPYGYLISAAMDGTNMVDRAATAVDGTFKFHLLEGNWEIRLENLPAEYKVVSMTLGEEKLRDRKFTLVKGAAPLPLQITVH